jgi:hypothetical protein
VSLARRGGWRVRGDVTDAARAGREESGIGRYFTSLLV